VFQRPKKGQRLQKRKAKTHCQIGRVNKPLKTKFETDFVAWLASTTTSVLKIKLKWLLQCYHFFFSILPKNLILFFENIFSPENKTKVSRVMFLANSVHFAARWQCSPVFK
jgi:hypothetical protein